MRALKTAAPFLVTIAVFGQVPTVDRQAIWIEKVESGDMPVSVQARGVLTSNRTAESRISETLAGNVEPGQAVSIDTSPVTGKGRVNRVAPNVIDGMVTVLVNLEPALPGEIRAGTEVSGTIQGPTLNNVAYVGRPVSCRPGSEGTLFKVEPGGQEAMRVKFGMGNLGIHPAKWFRSATA